MRLYKRRLILFFAVFFSLQAPAAEYFYYIAKPGDTLSQILYVHNIKPIYGKKGTLKKVLALNKKLVKTDGNRIIPGMRIRLIGDPLLLQTASSSTLRHEESSFQGDEALGGSRSDLSLSVTSRFLRIDSQDEISNANASFLSESAVGYKFTWGQSWNSALRSFLAFENYYVSMQDPTSSTRSLVGREQAIFEYSLGVEYLVSSGLKVNSSLIYGESLVNRSIDVNTLKIEKFNFPKIELGLGYRLAKYDSLLLDARVDAVILLPAKQDLYESELSLGSKFGLNVEDKIGELVLLGGVFYGNAPVKMESAIFEQVEFGLTFGLKKNFGASQ